MGGSVLMGGGGLPHVACVVQQSLHTASTPTRTTHSGFSENWRERNPNDTPTNLLAPSFNHVNSKRCLIIEQLLLS